MTTTTASASTRITIDVRGPYSLTESRAFLEGFTPASGGSASVNDSLALAFRLDGNFAPVGVLLTQAKRDGDVVCETVGGATTEQAAAIGGQAARMLGLDVDARSWGDIGERDPVLASVLALHPGFRPVAFASPWEAGVWGLLAHRINMKQAATIKKRVAEQHGDVVKLKLAAPGDDKSIALFPSPAQVLAMPKAPAGVPDEKWTRIGGLAQAAQSGALDAQRLRALGTTSGTDAALEELGKLRGVGAWTAGHIYLRGAATVDVVSLEEPRVVRAVQHAYGLKAEPTLAEMTAISERWKPYRTWAMVLLAMHLNRTGQWSAASDGAKRGRGAATKVVARSKKKSVDAKKTATATATASASAKKPATKQSSSKAKAAVRAKTTSTRA